MTLTAAQTKALTKFTTPDQQIDYTDLHKTAREALVAKGLLQVSDSGVFYSLTDAGAALVFGAEALTETTGQILDKVAAQHEMEITRRETRRGIYISDRRCTCGEALPWLKDEAEPVFQRHLMFAAFLAGRATS